MGARTMATAPSMGELKKSHLNALESIVDLDVKVN